MNLERINPENIWAAPGYSHVVKAGNTVYIAGQVGQHRLYSTQLLRNCGFCRFSSRDRVGGDVIDFFTEGGQRLVDVGCAVALDSGRHVDDG